MPSMLERRANESPPPAAIIALEGIQSHRFAAPPTMSRSIMVTCAPRRAAVAAAAAPAGPPPSMTRRTGMSCRLIALLSGGDGHFDERAATGYQRVKSRNFVASRQRWFV